MSAAISETERAMALDWLDANAPGASEFSDLVRRLVAAAPAAAGYSIPGPYDIAMAFGAAAVASGKFENVGAAMAAAWFAIPEFYQARDQYLNQLAPAFYGTSPPEGAPPADDGGTNHIFDQAAA